MHFHQHANGHTLSSLLVGVKGSCKAPPHWVIFATCTKSQMGSCISLVARQTFMHSFPFSRNKFLACCSSKTNHFLYPSTDVTLMYTHCGYCSPAGKAWPNGRDPYNGSIFSLLATFANVNSYFCICLMWTFQLLLLFVWKECGPLYKGSSWNFRYDLPFLKYLLISLVRIFFTLSEI